MALELTRWNPFRDMVSLQEDVNRLFGDFWGRGAQKGWLQDGFWAPAVDLEETKDEVIVKAQLPGMKKEDITLQVQGDTLVLTGERRHESETKEKTIHLVESSYGRFQRIINLPSDVEGNRAKATYEAGVLTVRLPKSEQAKPKEIAIDVR
ncbi:MAG: Hsp20/alpha crystallin family protein [Candidatus Omnitrophica bacterium]|nr:Hsp20/alpha crystallin family protein [Candidatus Omnitrophota bacterium]